MWYDSLMRFRDDIDPATTFVTADSHFGHENIVGFCHRPDDHEQVMLAEWRKEVPDQATVLHLGDLAYRNNGFFKNIIAPELTGQRKLLIMGNHDRQRYSFYRAAGFQIVRPFAIHYESARPHQTLDNAHIVSFSHYPWSEDEDGSMGKFDLRIHGHIHNNGYSRDAFIPFLKNHINVGVEQTKYRPVNLKLLLDAYLFGEYPETTDEQRAEARERKEAHA